MDPSKVDTIVNWPSFINIKDIQSFLGVMDRSDESLVRTLRLHIEAQQVARLGLARLGRPSIKPHGLPP